jgi:hypothetical protein
VDDRAGGPPTRWTPRARTIAASLFLLGAVIGFGAALFGAVCDSLSFDCVRNEGKNAIRIAVIALPFIVYGVYRFTRSPGDHRRDDDAI